MNELEPLSDGPRVVAVLLSCDTFENFFTRGLGLDRTGYAERYRNDWSWEYAAQMKRVGLDLRIYVPTFGHDEHRRTHDGHVVRWIHLNRLARIFEIAPLLGRTPIGRWVSQALYAVAMMRSLRTALRSDGAVTLYVQEYWTGRFDVLSIIRPGRVRVVGADHGGRARRQLKLLKPVSFRSAAALTSQTTEEAATVRKWGGRPVLAPNPVDTDFFHPASETPLASRSILHVARLVETHKRTSLVIRSMPLLPPDVSLDIVGDGPDRPMLEALVDELGLTDRVRFLGFVTDRNRLRSIYQRAAALVQPSANEARLLAALESLACGTPCVLTRIPAFSEILSGLEVGGRLVDPDPSAIAAAVLSCLDETVSLRRESRTRAEKQFSWNQHRAGLAGVILGSPVSG